MLRRSLLPMAVLTLALTAWIASSNADKSSVRSGEAQLIGTIQHLQKQLHSVDQAHSEYFKGVALASENLGAFEATLPQGLTLDRNRAYSLAAHGAVGIYFPISGSVGRSMYTIWFSEVTAEPVYSMSILQIYNHERNIAVTTRINGKVVFEGLETHDGIPLFGHRYDENGRRTTVDTGADGVPGFIACMTSCLAPIVGLAYWALYSIIVTCAIACAVPAPICLACIAGLGILGGTAGYACYDWCKDVIAT